MGLRPHPTSFREGALLAVNLGDDADTTGAVYGQLAGRATTGRTASRPSGGAPGAAPEIERPADALHEAAGS